MALAARPRRIAVGMIVTALGLGALAACAPESEPGPAITSAPSPTPTEAPTSPAPSPSPTSSDDPADAQIELPADCTGVYSGTMLARLDAENPPLNDPGVTLLPTELPAALEVLDMTDTIRCSWGQPSEFGLATNVTIVDEPQAATVRRALSDAGMECSDLTGGTLCRITTEIVENDEVFAIVGETHYLRGNGWVATHWINYGPDGYTEDIVAALWD